MKITDIITILFLINFFLLIQSTSAINLSSGNYSVGMFGTGIATATPSSANYNSTALTEAKGTTRNAESGTSTANIGFFENISYYRIVSITSYEIYPDSAVQGSIIRLSISALNSQSVWAVLTLPNSTLETISLTNDGNSYYTANNVGVYTVTFYANSSQGNLASVIDTFEITSSVTPTVTSPSSGGGGTTTIIEKCNYIWDCTAWNICLNGNQTRKCENIGNCTGIEGKPIETRECSDALFDVVMKLKEVELTTNKTLNFSIDLIETKGIEKIDVQIRYSIINNNKTEIFSQIETRAIQGNLIFEKEISEIKLVEGEYIIRVDILYGNLQRAFAEQKFEVKDGGLKISPEKRFIDKSLIIYGILIIIIILLIIILIRKKKNKRKNYAEYKRKVKQNLIKIRGKNLLIILVSFALIGALLLKVDSITGFVVESAKAVNNWNVFEFVLLIGILGLLTFLFRNRIKIFINKIKENIKSRYRKESLKGLINKKVYSENGNYFGIIEEVIIESGENKIDSLKIRLDKKHKFKTKGAIIDYKFVKGISEIVIIDEKILEKLSQEST